MFRTPASVLLLLLLSTSLSAQLGGSSVFNVLDIPASARVASLGGNQIAVLDNDLNLALYNPALLNKDMSDQLALSYLNWFSDAGINIGYASFAHHFDSMNTTGALSLQFVDYGTFTRTDETGEELGTFTAGEYAFSVGAGRQIDSLFHVGVNLKGIYSALEDYVSTGLAVDIGGVYVHPKVDLTVAAMLRNIGYQFNTYTDQREDLPFQVQLGTTYKFKYAPFRLGLVLENLQKWDLTYDDPNQQVLIDPTTGEPIVEEVTFTDRLLRHVIFNTEIILTENLHLRFGYNYRRRQELKVDGKPGIVGVSFGAGLRVSKFHISYGHASYHQAGSSNSFTVAMRFADFKRTAD